MADPDKRKQSPGIGRACGLYLGGNLQGAIRCLDQMLESPEQFEPHKLHHAQRLKDMWTKANDPDWQPEPNADYEACAPLHQRVRDAQRRGEHAAAIRDSWTLLQHAKPGTVSQSHALADLADSAALGGELELAQRAVEAYLAHNALLRCAALRGDTPIQYGSSVEDSTPHPEGLLSTLGFNFPIRAGITGIQASTAACWRELLESAVEHYLFTFHRVYREAVVALADHYTKANDRENFLRVRQMAQDRIAADRARFRSRQRESITELTPFPMPEGEPAPAPPDAGTEPDAE
jgi:hypothetical protein